MISFPTLIDDQNSSWNQQLMSSLKLSCKMPFNHAANAWVFQASWTKPKVKMQIHLLSSQLKTHHATAKKFETTCVNNLTCPIRMVRCKADAYTTFRTIWIGMDLDGKSTVKVSLQVCVHILTKSVDFTALWERKILWTTLFRGLFIRSCTEVLKRRKNAWFLP